MGKPLKPGLFTGLPTLPNPTLTGSRSRHLPIYHLCLIRPVAIATLVSVSPPIPIQTSCNLQLRSRPVALRNSGLHPRPVALRNSGLILLVHLDQSARPTWSHHHIIFCFSFSLFLRPVDPSRCHSHISPLCLISAPLPCSLPFSTTEEAAPRSTQLMTIPSAANRPGFPQDDSVPDDRGSHPLPRAPSAGPCRAYPRLRRGGPHSKSALAPSGLPQDGQLLRPGSGA
jgi:hypothetical protein